MKQTAVEWLLSQKMALTSEEFDDIIEQAKEMEKQQIIDAYVTPLSKEFWFKKDDIFNQQAEQYYNETYKNK
jgi:uncharacterized protein (DUF924 family)